MRIPIETNTYFIPERLKEIDPNYFVMFNTDIQKYEVHHKKQLNGTLAVTVPYNGLDARTIDLVQKTRIENINLILEEMDRENARLENQRYNQMMDEAAQKAKEIHRYASKSEHRDVVPDEAIKEFRR